MRADYTIDQPRRNRRIRSVVGRKGQRWHMLWHRGRWTAWIANHTNGSE